MSFPNALELVPPLPVDWEQRRARFLFQDVDDRSVTGKEALLSLTKNGLVPRTETTEKEARADSLIGYKKCQPGDIVMNKMQAWNGIFGVAKVAGIVSPEYTILRPRPGVNPAFYAAMFRTPPFVMEFLSRSRGMGTAFLRLNTEDFGEVVVPIPPPAKVHAIQNYLDGEIGRIDDLIAQKERLLALLEEKRQAVTSRAVTKGLDPSVPAEDSGVDWIGKVPKTWNVIRTRFLCRITTGVGDTQDAVSDGAFPFFVRSDVVERSNSFCFEGEAVLTSGDGAGVGKVFHHYTGKMQVHQRVYIFHQFRRVLGGFFFHYLRSQFANVTLAGTAKSTVDSLRRPMLADFPVAVPPVPEQKRILEFLGAFERRSAALGEKMTASISLLRERRQSLITEAVTGQLNPSVYMPKEVVTA